MNEFKREDRYLVFKRSEIEKYLNDDDKMRLRRIARDVETERAREGKPQLLCVVVESDWPEYEPVWEKIAARIAEGQLT